MIETAYDPQNRGYLAIREFGSSPSGKTRRFIVENRRRDEILGYIRWYGPWRQYTFYPEPLTVWSAGCLAEVQKYISGIAKRGAA